MSECAKYAKYLGLSSHTAAASRQADSYHVCFTCFQKDCRQIIFHPAEISRQHFEYLKVLVRFTLSSGTELYLQGFKDGLLWHVSLFLFKKEHQRALFYWPLESHPALLGEKNYFCFELRSLVT